jgi:Erg28 like protein
MGERCRKPADRPFLSAIPLSSAMATSSPSPAALRVYLAAVGCLGLVAVVTGLMAGTESSHGLACHHNGSPTTEPDGSIFAQHFDGCPGMSRHNVLAGRLFAAWNTVTTLLRVSCALFPRDRGLFLVCFASFFVSFLVYVDAVFVTKTARLSGSGLGPLVVAPASMLFMVWSCPERFFGARSPKQKRR